MPLRVPAVLTSALLAIVLAGSPLAAQESPAPKLSAGPGGFALASADGAHQLKLRGYVHVDGRFFVDDEERPGVDTLLVRRARPILEGTVYRMFDFRIMADLAGSSTSLQDAWVEAKFSPAVRLRAGKFKPPVGLERLQSVTDAAFVESALPTALVPNRDVGLQLGGQLGGGRFDYAVGLFNGVVDGGSADQDTNDGKEVAGRLLWKPFAGGDGTAAVDLALGLAVTHGDLEGTPTAPTLPAPRATYQRTFYSWRSDGTSAGTAIADGTRVRLAPQGYLYRGPFGLLAEWVSSEQSVRLDDTRADLTTEAWQLALSWVLTGERNGYRGVVPQRPFDPRGEGRGA